VELVNKRFIYSNVLFGIVLAVTACNEKPLDHNTVVEPATKTATETATEPATKTATETATEPDTETVVETEIEPVHEAGDYTGAYSVKDDAFGTQVTVTVTGLARTIVTNALPNHETGSFPNDGNPNTISSQNKTYVYTSVPRYVGNTVLVKMPGVALNGVKFEPGTAETVNCASGESFRVEGLQDAFDLGMDFNNAHVQPSGEYHYHGVSDLLINSYSYAEDLVHVGFAADGFLIYYSKSAAYRTSYVLATILRTGIDCSLSLPTSNSNFDLNGTQPDGTYTSDWVYIEGFGELDRCNGATVNGQYMYFITKEYPYISRCLNGDVSEEVPRGQNSDRPGDRPPPNQRR